MAKIEGDILDRFLNMPNSLKLYKGVWLIRPRAFRKDMIAHRNLVVAYSSLKPKSESDAICDSLFVKHVNREYKACSLEELSAKVLYTRVVGYIAISETEFVAVYNYRLPLFMVFALMLLFVVLALAGCGSNGETNQTSISQEERSNNSIDIPGYSDFIGSETKCDMLLNNPDGNTVNFEYLIYEVVSRHDTDKVFSTLEEAQDYCEYNSVDCSLVTDGDFCFVDSEGSVIDGGINQYVIKEDSGKYAIVWERINPIHMVKSLAPGEEVIWAVNESLGWGSHTIRVVINTYDVETGAKCYGTTQEIDVYIDLIMN